MLFFKQNFIQFLLTLTSLTVGTRLATAAEPKNANTAKCSAVLSYKPKTEVFESGLAKLASGIFSLRYKVNVIGLKEVADRGKTQTLFLARHEAFTDPPLVMNALGKDFAPSPAMDEEQAKQPVVGRLIGWAAGLVDTILVPKVNKRGAEGAEEALALVDKVVERIEAGGNVLIYPSGRFSIDGRERIGAKSIVARILEKNPNIRIVLVKVSGLYGSNFSPGGSETPGPVNLGKALVSSWYWPLLNGLFFMPKREVQIELEEAHDFPRTASKNEINKYLENKLTPDNIQRVRVPYHFIKGSKPIYLPPHVNINSAGGELTVSAAVIDKMKNIFIELNLDPSFLEKPATLASEAVDSLEMVNLIMLMEESLKVQAPEAESIVTISDLLRVASGQTLISASEIEVSSSRKWMQMVESSRPQKASLPKVNTVTEAFLSQAAKNPNKVILEDELSGPLTYRKIIMAIMIMAPRIKKMPGQHVGIMLPASSGGVVMYLATLFAGKTPVMVNFTAGPEPIKKSLELVGVDAVLTSKMFVSKLKQKNVDVSSIEEKYVFAEDLKATITTQERLKVLSQSYLNWGSLRKVKIDPNQPTVILFTSGSSAAPKAVPLTHKNVLANIRASTGKFEVLESDRIMGLLPPFHSFGHILQLMSVSMGLPTVFFPDPTDGRMIARLINAYKTSILVGTPKFLRNILDRSEKNQLESLRLVLAGAEAMPKELFDDMTSQYPNLNLLEGYGATELSPIVSVNPPGAARLGSAGQILDNLEFYVLHPETLQPVNAGQEGILVVRGESVFNGYFAQKPEQNPFVKVNGIDGWYSTGDIVTVDADRYVTIIGRKNRFYKKSGEMISVPSIERSLEKYFAKIPQKNGENAPSFVVESAGDNSDFVLFTIHDVDLNEVNAQILSAGLPRSHRIDKIVRVDSIPLLGTGKVDTKVFKEQLIKASEVKN